MDAEGEGVKHVEAHEVANRRFRYFDFVMAAFVAILLLSNVIGAGKIATVNLPGIGPWPFGAGILFFPLSYVIGDVLTEVYGFARARRCIWAGFVALIFMTITIVAGFSFQLAMGRSTFASPVRVHAHAIVFMPSARASWRRSRRRRLTTASRPS